MSNASVRCPMCGGLMENGKTMFGVDLGFGVVVVRDVPALVCTQCGEAHTEDSVAEKLEFLVARAREDHTEVAVTSWSDAVA